MGTTTKDLQQPHPWSLLFADNDLLVSEDREDPELETILWEVHLDNCGMRLNTKKTKYMESGRKTNGTINVNGEDLEKVTEIKYTGSVISSDGSTLSYIRAMVKMATGYRRSA